MALDFSVALAATYKGSPCDSWHMPALVGQKGRALPDGPCGWVFMPDDPSLLGGPGACQFVWCASVSELDFKDEQLARRAK